MASISGGDFALCFFNSRLYNLYNTSETIDSSTERNNLNLSNDMKQIDKKKIKLSIKTNKEIVNMFSSLHITKNVITSLVFRKDYSEAAGLGSSLK